MLPVKISVTDVQITDDLELLTDVGQIGAWEQWQQLVKADKTLDAMKRQYFSYGDGKNTLSKIVKEENIAPKLVYVTLEYTNETEQDMQDVYFFGSLMRIGEDNGIYRILTPDLQGADDVEYNIWAGTGEMQYYDMADEETGKYYIPEIKAGASQTVHMAWVVGEDEVDQLYLSLNAENWDCFTEEMLQEGQNARPEAPRLFNQDSNRLFQDPDEPGRILPVFFDRPCNRLYDQLFLHLLQVFGRHSPHHGVADGRVPFLANLVALFDLRLLRVVLPDLLRSKEGTASGEDGKLILLRYQLIDKTGEKASCLIRKGSLLEELHFRLEAAEFVDHSFRHDITAGTDISVRVHALADIFDVAPAALDVPDIDSYIGIMHTLFVLEDQYDLSADLIDGEPVLRFGTDIKKRDFLWNLFTSWAAEAARYRAGEISEEDYNAWRYHYPKFDKGNIWAEVPPDLK